MTDITDETYLDEEIVYDTSLNRLRSSQNINLESQNKDLKLKIDELNQKNQNNPNNQNNDDLKKLKDQNVNLFSRNKDLENKIKELENKQTEVPAQKKDESSASKLNILVGVAAVGLAIINFL